MPSSQRAMSYSQMQRTKSERSKRGQRVVGGGGQGDLQEDPILMRDI